MHGPGERTRKLILYLEVDDRRSAYLRIKRKINEIKRNNNKEEENHYTIKEGRRGRSRGCQLKTKVDGSSDGKSSNESTPAIFREKSCSSGNVPKVIDDDEGKADRTE